MIRLHKLYRRKYAHRVKNLYTSVSIIYVNEVNMMKNKIPNGLTNIIHKHLYRLEIILSSTRVKFLVKKMNEMNIDKSRPVIFAVNHSNSFDMPVTLKTIGHHCYILIGKQKLFFSDRFFFWLNGVIWIDRKSKSDMKMAKVTLEKYLQKKYPVIWFPEGTWNLTDNLLMLPMKWGIIDVARNAGAQIVPIALDYDRESMVCLAKYGETILIDETIDNKMGIRLLRDEMATARYELWEQKGICSRRDMNIQEEREKMMFSVEEYPPLDWEYESSCIYQPHTEPQDAFALLDKLIPCKENTFLFRKQ